MKAALREGGLRIAKPRPASTMTTWWSHGADPHEGTDPGHGSGGPQKQTMRHWITSFRLLTTWRWCPKKRDSP